MRSRARTYQGMPEPMGAAGHRHIWQLASVLPPLMGLMWSATAPARQSRSPSQRLASLPQRSRTLDARPLNDGSAKQSPSDANCPRPLRSARSRCILI